MIATRVGYAGGSRPNPSYHQVGDHLEAVEVTYDPRRVSYDELLAHFWSAHPSAEPAAPSRVREAVLWSGDRQRDLAVASQRAMARRAGEQLATAVLPEGTFWPAEELHQKFHLQRMAPALVDELAAQHGGRDAFLGSTLAAHLNALAGGFGDEQLLRSTAAVLGREPQALRLVLAGAVEVP